MADPGRPVRRNGDSTADWPPVRPCHWCLDEGHDPDHCPLNPTREGNDREVFDFGEWAVVLQKPRYGGGTSGLTIKRNTSEAGIEGVGDGRD